MSSSPTDTLVARRDAEDGDLGLRGDDPRVAQAARRLGRGRRDDRRRDHRQGRRRDPLPGQRPAGADRRRGGRHRRRSASRSPRSTPGRRAGEAHPDEDDADRRSQNTDGSARTRPTALASTRRSSGGSPTSTASTSSQVEGTGIGGRVRKKDVLAHVETGNGEGRRRSCTRESPYKPEPAEPEPPSEPTGERREPMTPMRKAIAEHMLASRGDRRALHDDRRGRHVAGRGAAGRAQGGDGPPGRAC